MRLCVVFIAVISMTFLACDGGGDTPPADTGTPDAVTDSGGGDSSGGDSGSDAAGGNTYADSIAPIFIKYCKRCHDNIAPAFTADASTLDGPAAGAAAPACAGKTVAECIAIRMADGSMPNDGGCSGDSPDATKCPTAEETKAVEDWVAAGAAH
jgi:hypothetical protein